MTLWASSTPCRFSRLADIIGHPPLFLLSTRLPSERAREKRVTRFTMERKESQTNERLDRWVGGWCNTIATTLSLRPHSAQHARRPAQLRMITSSPGRRGQPVTVTSHSLRQGQVRSPFSTGAVPRRSGQRMLRKQRIQRYRLLAF